MIKLSDCCTRINATTFRKVAYHGVVGLLIFPCPQFMQMLENRAIQLTVGPSSPSISGQGDPILLKALRQFSKCLSEQLSAHNLRGIQTITQVDDRAQHRRFSTFPHRFISPDCCSLGIILPEIDPMAQPIMAIPTGLQRSLSQDHRFRQRASTTMISYCQ